MVDFFLHRKSKMCKQWEQNSWSEQKKAILSTIFVILLAASQQWDQTALYLQNASSATNNRTTTLICPLGGERISFFLQTAKFLVTYIVSYIYLRIICVHLMWSWLLASQQVRSAIEVDRGIPTIMQKVPKKWWSSVLFVIWIFFILLSWCSCFLMVRSLKMHRASIRQYLGSHRRIQVHHMWKIHF